HLKNSSTLAIEAGAVDHELRVPIHQLDDDLDALLLPNGADAEHRWHVHETDAANFHVVALQLVTTSEQHFGAATRHHHHVVRHQAVSPLDEIEHALGLADAAPTKEEQAHAEHVAERAVKRGRWRKLFLEPRLDAREEFVGLESRANDRHARARGHLHHL